jgi:hypothetical protein
MEKIKLKNMNTSLEDVLELLHNEKDGYKYELKISRPNEHDFRICIKKVYHDCIICKREYNLNYMVIRQDKRVPKLFMPKLICKYCVKSVDNLIDSLKISQPRHLKQLTP